MVSTTSTSSARCLTWAARRRHPRRPWRRCSDGITPSRGRPSPCWGAGGRRRAAPPTRWRWRRRRRFRGRAGSSTWPARTGTCWTCSRSGGSAISSGWIRAPRSCPRPGAPRSGRGDPLCGRERAAAPGRVGGHDAVPHGPDAHGACGARPGRDRAGPQAGGGFVAVVNRYLEDPVIEVYRRWLHRTTAELGLPRLRLRGWQPLLDGEGLLSCAMGSRLVRCRRPRPTGRP